MRYALQFLQANLYKQVAGRVYVGINFHGVQIIVDFIGCYYPQNVNNPVQID